MTNILSYQIISYNFLMTSMFLDCLKTESNVTCFRKVWKVDSDDKKIAVILTCLNSYQALGYCVGLQAFQSQQPPIDFPLELHESE